MARNNENCVIDYDPSIPVVTTPITPMYSQHASFDYEDGTSTSEVFDYDTMGEDIVLSGFLYDTSTIEEDEEDNYMVSEMQTAINIASSSSLSSSNHNYVNNIPNASTDPTHQDQKIMRSLKNFYGYCGCYRPPFHVTAMYLWTQFNISYLLRKFSFLFDIHDSNYNDPYMDVDPSQHQYFHLVTIHYLEMGIMDIIVMNLIITLFLSTSFAYRSWQGALSYQSTPPTTATTTTTAQRSLQCRQQSYRSKSCLLELVTLVTFLLLILRKRGAAINVILICTIFMFLHLISRLFPSTLPSLLLFPYKL